MGKQFPFLLRQCGQPALQFVIAGKHIIRGGLQRLFCPAPVQIIPGKFLLAAHVRQPQGKDIQQFLPGIIHDPAARFVRRRKPLLHLVCRNAVSQEKAQPFRKTGNGDQRRLNGEAFLIGVFIKRAILQLFTAGIDLLLCVLRCQLEGQAALFHLAESFHPFSHHQHGSHPPLPASSLHSACSAHPPVSFYHTEQACPAAPAAFRIPFW